MKPTHSAHWHWVAKILLLIALACSAPAPLQGADYYVRKDGSDSNNGLADTAGGAWLTIQHGCDTMPAGGNTLHVRAGLYNENISISKAGTSLSAPWAIEGNRVAALHKCSIAASKSYVTLSGLLFTNLANHGETYVTVGKSANDGVITNCIFDNHNGDIYHTNQFIDAVWGTGAVSLEDGTFSLPLAESDNHFPTDSSDRWRIISNVFTAFFDKEGVFYVGGDGNVIEYNVMTNWYRGDIVHFFGSNNVFRGNFFSNNHSYCTEMHHWWRTNQAWCEAHNGQWTETNAPHPTVTHADLWQVHGDNNGMRGIGSKDHLIEKNVYVDHYSQLCQQSQKFHYGCTNIGNLTIRNNIFIGYGANAGNTIVGNRWYNNLFYWCATNMIDEEAHINQWYDWMNFDPTNHVFDPVWRDEEAAGNAINFSTSHPTNVTGYGTSSNSIVVNNIFLNCGPIGAVNMGWWNYYSTDTGLGASNSVMDHNYVAKNNYGAVNSDSHFPPHNFYFYETNGINGGAPGFVRESALNFHLRSTSILATAGMSLSGFPGAPTDDFEGNPRPSGNWSIGPFQINTNLKVHLDFGGNFVADKYVEDVSGNGHHAWCPPGTNGVAITNWIQAGTGPSGQCGMWSQVGYMVNDPPNIYGLSQYACITNLTGIQYLTNGTFAALILWGSYVTPSNGVNRHAVIMDAGGTPQWSEPQWLYQTNAWSFQYGTRDNSYSPSGGTFLRWDELDSGHPDELIQFTQTRDSNTWYHAAVTWNPSTQVCVGYSNGIPFTTNAFTFDFLRVGGRDPWHAGDPWGRIETIPWIALGASMHDSGSLTWGDDRYPNDGFFIGKMDEVRLYNRDLSAAEITRLYSVSMGGSGTATEEEETGPTLVVDPTVISVTRLTNVPDFTQTFTIENSGIGTLYWTNTEALDWITLDAETGDCTTETDTITVTFHTDGLSAGANSGTITVTSTNGVSGSPAEVSVSMTLTNGLPPSAAEAVTRSALRGKVQLRGGVRFN